MVSELSLIAIELRLGGLTASGLAMLIGGSSAMILLPGAVVLLPIALSAGYYYSKQRAKKVVNKTFDKLDTYCQRLDELAMNNFNLDVKPEPQPEPQVKPKALPQPKKPTVDDGIKSLKEKLKKPKRKGFFE